MPKYLVYARAGHGLPKECLVEADSPAAAQAAVLTRLVTPHTIARCTLVPQTVTRYEQLRIEEMNVWMPPLEPPRLAKG